MSDKTFWLYILVMALVTYLIRMLPLVLVRKKIENKFIISFLHYIPYAVLSVMTIPAIFYSTAHRMSAAAGFLTAIILSYFGQSLLKVAAFSSIAVFAVELVLMNLC